MFGVKYNDITFRLIPLGTKVTTKGFLKQTDGRRMKIFAIVIREDLNFDPCVYYRIGEHSGDKPYLVPGKYLNQIGEE